MNKQAVLSLSGGMDSSTLLLHLLANGYEVTALSFDYGQKHRVELERAKELVNYLNSNYINDQDNFYMIDKVIAYFTNANCKYMYVYVFINFDHMRL